MFREQLGTIDDPGRLMTVRWGIIGCGDVVRKRVAAAIQSQSGSELVAACRRSPEPLHDFCRTFNVPGAYTQAEALLADSRVDAVYIATPVNCHLPQTVAAACAGKHVLVEKPMGLSTAECDEMIEVCQKHGATLGVAYYRRFYPVVERIRQWIADGSIGRPLCVTATTCNPFQMGPNDEGYWRVIPGSGGGGALMDIGSHRIDLLLYLFGDVADVVGQCDTCGADYQADNCTTLMLRFRCGVHGVLHCYFGAEYDPDEFTVMGTRGRIVASRLNDGDLTLYTSGGAQRESHPPADNLNSPLIADFVDAVQSGKEPCVSGSEGRATNEIMERAYQR